MKSSDALSPKQRAVWAVVRYFVPRRMRWFYEGHPKMRGQLWYDERKLLYRTVRKFRPSIAFEIGTWKGGGSTLFISQGLHDNGIGQLHTIETNEVFFEESRSNYEQYLPELASHVAFHRGDYRQVYAPILRDVRTIDFLFLDGAENAEETLQQYQFFLPHLKRGTVLMAHDWFTTKCALLRSEVERTAQWEIISVLTPPRSVGLMIAVRKYE